MSAQATVRSLMGLIHDLTDEEVEGLVRFDNRPAVKELLSNLAAQAWRQVSYDQSLGLRALIKRAVGERNYGNINSDITPERFPLVGTDTRLVNARVEPYLQGETSEQAAVRLMNARHKLGNTGDLSAFLHDHPEVVEKWACVLAISEDSRWAGPGGCVCVPYASVCGTIRRFDLDDFRSQLDSDYGVLVLSE